MEEGGEISMIIMSILFPISLVVTLFFCLLQGGDLRANIEGLLKKFRVTKENEKVSGF